ncbi:MAG: AtpZ/AtpI family protein [Ilumatobacteraceae bacterium]|nr:AtpZ/AtpI family protein [Ilumatobacteraceae bacterium]
MKLLPTRKQVVRNASPSDDSLGRGAEISVSVGVFLAIGLLVDNWLGTRPIFTIALSLFSLLGSFVRMWYVYDGNMQVQEIKRQRAATSHIVKQDAGS